MTEQTEENYEEKKQRLIAQMVELNKLKSTDIGLNKNTSNLFRSRNKTQQRLNARDFNKVISVDRDNLTAEVEGMTTFDDFVKATLQYSALPLVVPQLKTITVGGAISGLGIESSSWKYGLVHEGVISMEVLLPTGEVVECTKDNKYSDLFYGLPNSYGTLGYILKLKIKIRHAKKYVHVKHISYKDPEKYFKDLEKLCNSGKYEGDKFDFIDGVAFGPNDLYISVGIDTDFAPYTSDYTYMNIYYKSLRTKNDDFLSTYDYIWRWDTDWFWCSKNLYADRKIVRRILGRKRLGSATYSRLMLLNDRYRVFSRLQKLTMKKSSRESIIQDIEVTIDKSENFLTWFQKKIDIRPVWVCPTKSTTDSWPYALYPMNPNKIYVNFGFWDSIPTKHDPSSGYYNKLVESEVDKLGGMKSLYSTVFYNKETFEKKYNYQHFIKLKNKYDPKAQLKGLYEKCVQR